MYGLSFSNVQLLRREKDGKVGSGTTMRTPSGRQVICFADRTAFFIFVILGPRDWDESARKIFVLLLLRREIFCTRTKKGGR